MNGGILLTGNINGWKKLISTKPTSDGGANLTRLNFTIQISSPSESFIGKFEIHYDYNSRFMRVYVDTLSTATPRDLTWFKIARKSDNSMDFYLKNTGNYQNWAIFDVVYSESAFPNRSCLVDGTVTLYNQNTTTPDEEPVVGSTYVEVVNPSYFPYHNGVAQQ